MAKLFKLGLAFLLISLLVLGSVLFYLNKQVTQPINLSAPTLFRVEPGQSAKGVLNRLKRQGVLTNNLGLKVRLKLEPSLSNIKVGTYQLMPSMTGIDLLTLLVDGQEAQFTISLVEGLRWKDWEQSIKNHPRVVVKEDFQQRVKELKGQLIGESLEGWLLPDTYHFSDQTDAYELLSRANHAMHQYLQQAWENRALDLPYQSAYEGLILASIIEKETGVAKERPRIAGVFVNRLNLNMRLQTDPTVIYGMGDNFDGNIRRKDLRTPTPYNTYVIKGLPPTPIAMPSRLAIDAAFHPDTTDELYFVAKGDGSHKFSVTLQEHNSAVRKYQLKK